MKWPATTPSERELLIGGRAAVVWMGGCAARPSPLSALNGAYLSGLPRLSAGKKKKRAWEASSAPVSQTLCER